jgi:broad specificity phosphatase PhoE
MKTLEIRRHCLTKKGEQRGHGSQLSSAGVIQARAIGRQIGPFDWVLTSHVTRTLETAIAMGFAVDEQLEVLGDIPQDVWDEIGHQERWDWPQPFVTFAQHVASGGPTARMGQRQRAAWLLALESVPDEGSALIISHGRVIEAGLVACVPEGDFAAWGPPFQHGEGVQLAYQKGQFGAVKFQRNFAED